MELEPGQLIRERYRLGRPLARGGMGALWLAEDGELGRPVVLKFPRAEGAATGPERERFRKEARALANIQSPHVVQIHDFGIENESPFIVMERLSGVDLESFALTEGPLSTPVALDLMAQAGRGIAQAHERGIIHRDVKPSNLFLARYGDRQVVKVLDFGIAQQAQMGAETTGNLTFGSPHYMSPEQTRGQRLSERADVWALGATLYRLLAGRSPFQGESAGDLFVRICTEDPTPLRALAPSVPPELESFVARCLSRDATQRPANAGEFVRALEELGAPSSEEPTARLSSAPSHGRATETQPLSTPTSAAAAKEPAPVEAAVRPSEVWAERKRPPPVERSRLAVVALGLAGAVGGLALLLLWPSQSPTPKPQALPSPQTAAPQAAAPSAAVQPNATSTGSAEPAPAPARAEPTPRSNKANPLTGVPPKPSRPKAAEKPRGPTGKPLTHDPVFGLPVDRSP